MNESASGGHPYPRVLWGLFRSDRAAQGPGDRRFCRWLAREDAGRGRWEANLTWWWADGLGNRVGKRGKGRAPSLPAESSGRQKTMAIEVMARSVTTS